MALNYDKYEESDAIKRLRAQAEAANTYVEPESVARARDALSAHESTRPGAWNGGSYADALTNTMNAIANREKFKYDLNADALYQQYKDKYINQGRLAMQDTIGQASALTGGYGNSYAAMAGNQAYQANLQNLNDIVPQLYQAAYDRYNQEGQDLYNQASLYDNMYNREYGEYRDSVSDWGAEQSRLADRYDTEYSNAYRQWSDNYSNATNAYRDARDTEYDRYLDAYNMALKDYNARVEEDAAVLKDKSAAKASIKAASYGVTNAISGKNGKSVDYVGADAFAKGIIDRKYWGTGMTSAQEKKYGSYDNYVAATISEGLDSGKISKEDALKLLNLYGLNR